MVCRVSDTVRGIALAALLSPLHGAQAGTIAGHELLEWCEDEAFMRFACVSYLSGVQDTVESLRTLDMDGRTDTGAAAHAFCIPQDTDGRELVRVYMAYAKNNRPYLERAASSLTITAFANTWPCGTEAQGDG